jgi:hypothetical protein
MAKVPVFTDDAVNPAVNALTALLDSGYLRIYDASTTLLAELRYASTAFGAASAGVATANTITSDTDANATGTASKFKSYTSSSTLMFYGTVGTSTLFDLKLNTVAISSGAEVSVSAQTLTLPKST